MVTAQQANELHAKIKAEMLRRNGHGSLASFGGSNNGTDWYDIQQYTNTNSAYGASSWFYVDIPQTFEMFRLYILSGHFSSYVMINELEFYGN